MAKCRDCGSKLPPWKGIVRCLSCRIESQYVRCVEDPSGCIPRNNLILPGMWRETLRDGYWPPGSVWRHQGKYVIVRGNEDLPPYASEERFAPQRAEAIAWVESRRYVVPPLRRLWTDSTSSMPDAN